MGNPIAHGVLRGLQGSRAPQRARAGTPLTAWTYFVIVTLGLSWLTLAMMPVPAPGAGLFRATLYYAATMGWQPLIGAWLAAMVRHEVRAPSARRWPRPRDLGVGLVVGAIVVGIALGLGAAIREVSVSAVAAALAVLLVHTTIEEHGWRGRPLVWLVERLGTPAALGVHSAVWGLWYAPMFIVTRDEPSLAAAGVGIAIGAAAGTVLGGLRLWTGGIAAGTVANLVVTAAVSLPLILLGR